MISYRDRTYCAFAECSKFCLCDRALTEKVMDDARQWWGSEDAPIAQFMGEPECLEVDREV